MVNIIFDNGVGRVEVTGDSVPNDHKILIVPGVEPIEALPAATITGESIISFLL